MSIELIMPSNHLILWHPLLLLPSIFPSIRVFTKEAVLHIRWPKYWNFSFSISPSNEYSELTSFRIDWLYLLSVQGTLKSLLQHHSSKASILWPLIHFSGPLIYFFFNSNNKLAAGLYFSPCEVNSVLFSSVAQSCLTVCHSMDCSTPGLPIRHQLPEFA